MIKKFCKNNEYEKIQLINNYFQIKIMHSTINLFINEYQSHNNKKMKFFIS